MACRDGAQTKITERGDEPSSFKTQMQRSPSQWTSSAALHDEHIFLTDRHRQMMESMKGFTAGGLAGCCGKTIVAPFSRVTILMQVQSMQNIGQKRLGFLASIEK